MVKILIILSLYISILSALKVNITEDMPNVEVKVNGKKIKIERIQDTNHKLNNSYIKTSRPTPPFFIQPFTPIKGVKTVGELELLDFIKNRDGLLIDARMPKWYQHSTIPSAINIPFSMLIGKRGGYFSKKILKLLDSKKLLIFDNGPWCQQATTLMRELIDLGYPKSKILYYRGGMQFWQIVGLTTIKPTQIGKITKEFQDELELNNHIINLAGKQRMLTQMMSKDALALSFDPNSTTQLRSKIELFDKTLYGLRDGDESLGLPKTKSNEIIKEVDKISLLWEPFKKNLLKLINNSGDLSTIIKENENLLRQSDLLVKLLKKEANSNYIQKARSNIIDTAGRERMLTQKMTKERFLIDLNINKNQNQQKLKDTVKLFEDSLNALMYGDKSLGLIKPTNKTIKDAYNDIKRIWMELKPMYEKESLSIKDLVKLNRKNLKLLKMMDRAVKLSEKARDY